MGNNQQFRSAALGPYCDGVYSEEIITNITNRDIVIIYPDNKRVNYPSSGSSGNGTPSVRITKRMSDGPHVPGRNAWQDTELPFIEKYIPLNEILNEPQYEPVLSIVICTREQAPHTTHPAMGFSCYNDAVNQLMDEIKEKDITPTVRVMANDPKQNHQKLYWSFGGVVLEIPVTNYDAEHADITFIIHKGQKRLYELYRSIDELDKCESKLDFGNGSIIYIGTSQKQVEAALIKDKEARKNEGRTVKDLIEEKEKEFNEEKGRLKDKWNADLEAKNIEVSKLKNQVSSLQNNLDCTEKQLSEWRGMAEARKDNVKYESETKKAQYSQETAETKKRQAEDAAASERRKQTAEIIKLVLQVGCVIAAWYFGSKNKS